MSSFVLSDSLNGVRRFFASAGLSSRLSAAQSPTPPTTSGSVSAIAPQPTAPVQYEMPKSHNPLNAYLPDHVPEPELANSPRLDQLVRDGKLYLSLKDAIDLALENNLDLAIARYNLPIANTDILRTQAGGFFRGVNTGVVQGTPGGGVGGFGTGAPGGGRGRNDRRRGWRRRRRVGFGAVNVGRRNSGVVVRSDPQSQWWSRTSDFSCSEPADLRCSIAAAQYRTGECRCHAVLSDGNQHQFFVSCNARQTTNSPFFNLSPTLSSTFRFQIQQELLAGFGFGPNLRYLRIAKNNKKISDIAFKDQVIATVTQIENIYWDLVSAYEQTQVNEQSFAFAQQTLDNAKKQLQLESVPAMDVMRAEAEVSKRDQDLTVARTSLQLQETLMKNAITKSLDDPVLEAMPVVPTDRMQTSRRQAASRRLPDLISEAHA